MNLDGTVTVDPLADVKNGAWLDQQKFAPLRWVIQRLIVSGLAFLIAGPKIGKSWLLLALGLALASGGKVLGVQVEKRPVLYLALEDGDRRIQDRARALLAGGPIPAGFEFVTATGATLPLDIVRAWFALHPDGVTMVDTFGVLDFPREANESAYKYEYRAGRTLKTLIDPYPDASLIVAHHDRKAAADDFVDASNGTKGITGAADSVLYIARKRGAPDGTFHVVGRDIEDGAFLVDFVNIPGGAEWRLRGNSLESAAAAAEEAASPDGEKGEVLACLKEHGGPIAPAIIGRAINMPSAAVSAYLNRLESDGLAHKIGRGNWYPGAAEADVVVARWREEVGL